MIEYKLVLGISFILTPSIYISPDSGRYSFLIYFNMVDFPLPLLPKMADFIDLLMTKETSFNT